MSRIWIVFQKEMVDNVRDRRSVGNALLYVLMNPLLFVLLFGFIGRTVSEKAEAALLLPVQGAMYAPSLIAFLEQQNVEVLPAPLEPEQALREGKVDVVLVIPDSYEADFRAGEPVGLDLLVDSSNQGATVSMTRVQSLLAAYSGQLAGLRLLARGISPTVVTPLNVQQQDVADQVQGSSILALLPAVLLMAAFLGGYYLAADTTAGERERESLEPLLVNPVPRWQIVIGKSLAVFVFALVAVVLAGLTYVGLLALPQLQSFIGFRIELELAPVLYSLLLMLPVVIMAVALEVLLGTYARTQKEAQTYVSYLSLVGFMPAMFLSVLPVGRQPWMEYIPTIAQSLFIKQLLQGETLNPVSLLVSTLFTLLLAAASILAAIHLYNKEQIVIQS